MTVQDRFLKYVQVHTASDPDNEQQTPSSACQWTLAELLKEEMLSMGILDARISQYGYVYGSIPATSGYEDAPALGLIAHMDTSPDFCGEHVHPQIIENYD